MAQTNHAWRKVVSVFLCLVMCFTSYVLCVPMANAVITDDGASMKKTDKYGTEPWDGNADRWGQWYVDSGRWIRTDYASHIYLDVTETLESAGYKIKVTWNYGDGTDYRIAVLGGVWGENDDYNSSAPDDFFTMGNMFSNYRIDASYGTGGNSSSHMGTYMDSYGSYRGNELIRWVSTGDYDHTAYIYMMGTPTGEGTGTYNTLGMEHTFIYFEKKEWNGWKSNNAKSKPTSSSYNVWVESDGKSWPEIGWDITIYDKSALQAEIDRAEAFKSAFQNYQNNVISGDTSWQTFVDALEAAKRQIKVREQEQSDLDNAQDALYDAAYAVLFNSDVSNLNAQITTAESYLNNTNLANEYTSSTISALQTAYNAAKAYSQPSRWGPYQNPANQNLSQFTTKANELQAEQDKVDELEANLRTAISSMMRRADFSAYDKHVAENPEITGTCYTTDSYSAYTTAKAEVERLKADTNLSVNDQTQVKSAIDAYIAAYEDLVVQHTPALDEPTGNHFDGDCQNAPWVEYLCSVCGEPAIAYGTIDPDAHKIDAGVITREPTCTTDGVKTFSCTVDGCSYSYTEPIDADGETHTASDRIFITAETCVTDRVINHLCAECDHIMSTEIVLNTATGHNLGAYTVTTPATCTSEGVETAYCQNEGCDHFETRPVAMLAHSWVEDAESEDNVAATCKHTGVQAYKCANCTETKTETTPINSSNHESLALSGVVAATCQAEGYSGDMVCSACGVTTLFGHPTERDYTNHASTDTYTEGAYPATCTTDGQTGTVYYSCCGLVKEQSEPIPMLGHNFLITRTVAPTCTADGYDLYTCSRCQETEHRNPTEKNENNHTGERVLLPETVIEMTDCTKPYNTGDYKYTCCGTIVSGAHEAPYGDHEWDWENGVKQDNGDMVYPCLHQGCTVTHTVDHEHTGGTATCISQAICTECGEPYGSVDSTNHVHTTDYAEQEATCTTDGREAGTYCEDCKQWVEGGEIIEAAPEHGHEAEENREAIPATCSTNGREAGVYCTVCDTWVSGGEIIEAAPEHGHEAEENREAIAATCEAPGREAGVYCTACNTWVSGGATIEQLEHNYQVTATLVLTKATCIEPAFIRYTYTCVNGCEDSRVTEMDDVNGTLNPNNHQALVTIPAVDPTCTDTGLTAGSHCNDCGIDVVPQEEVPSLGGHKYQWVTTGGSCTEGVTKQLKCTVCGDIKETITEEPTGHTLGEWTVTLEPGCTTAGSRYALCSVCGETVTESIPATGHTYGEGVLILHPEDADDGIGLMRYTCINCGYWYDREITDTGHTHHGGTATCVDRAVCEECGREYGGYDSSNHVNVVPMPDAEATCETDGHTGGTYCTACGATVDEPVITTPATGHVDADGDGICDVDGKPVTTEDDDEEDDIWSGYRCKMCDEYEENKDKPFIGFFYMIIHFFVHLISYINYLT